MEKYIVDFNRPCLTGKEFEYIGQSIQQEHISGGGPFSEKCEEFLEESLGSAKAFLTTSCTDALEMAAVLLDIKPGDEVILPSFTFVSTANAFVLRGARPVFVDIRPDTFNLDENLVAKAITSKTRAIVPVHYAGVGCEMEDIILLSSRTGISIVEDNAHGLFGSYRGQYLGTFGSMASLSFHETKNFTCGEGGALLINDNRYTERARIIREKGTNRSKFFSGEIDKYTWIDIGSSYMPSDILAAFLFAQLEARDRIQAARKAVWENYSTNLREWAYGNDVLMPHIPDDRDQSYHMFFLLAPSQKHRDRLITHLKSKGICSVFHYLPLHLSRMGKRWGSKKGDCPVTESITGRILRLPFYNDMTNSQQRYVVKTIKEFEIKA